jgi:hypothetical protein
VNLDFGCLIHPQHLIAIEVGLLDPALPQRDLAIERRRNAEDDRALDLRPDSVGIDDDARSRLLLVIGALGSGGSFLASALAMARMARCTEPTGMPVPLEIMRTLRPAFLRSSTIMRRRAVSARIPGRVPVAGVKPRSGSGAL